MGAGRLEPTVPAPPGPSPPSTATGPPPRDRTRRRLKPTQVDILSVPHAPSPNERAEELERVGSLPPVRPWPGGLTSVPVLTGADPDQPAQIRQGNLLATVSLNSRDFATRPENLRVESEPLFRRTMSVGDVRVGTAGSHVRCPF